MRERRDVRGERRRGNLARRAWRAMTPRHGLLPFIVTGLAVTIPIWLALEPLLAPFDSELSVRTDEAQYHAGDRVVITRELVVHRRVRATFLGYWRSTEGRIEGQIVAPPQTGKVGRFELVVARPLPLDATPGVWCWLVAAELDYNFLRDRVVRPYAPACVEVVP